MLQREPANQASALVLLVLTISKMPEYQVLLTPYTPAPPVALPYRPTPLPEEVPRTPMPVAALRSCDWRMPSANHAHTTSAPISTSSDANHRPMPASIAWIDYARPQP